MYSLIRRYSRWGDFGFAVGATFFIAQTAVGVNHPYSRWGDLWCDNLVFEPLAVRGVGGPNNLEPALPLKPQDDFADSLWRQAQILRDGFLGRPC